jgi:hypothetical protein
MPQDRFLPPLWQHITTSVQSRKLILGKIKLSRHRGILTVGLANIIRAGTLSLQAGGRSVGKSYFRYRLTRNPQPVFISSLILIDKRVWLLFQQLGYRNH